jgi:hypothetical protein
MPSFIQTATDQEARFPRHEGKIRPVGYLLGPCPDFVNKAHLPLGSGEARATFHSKSPPQLTYLGPAFRDRASLFPGRAAAPNPQHFGRPMRARGRQGRPRATATQSAGCEEIADDR